MSGWTNEGMERWKVADRREGCTDILMDRCREDRRVAGSREGNRKGWMDGGQKCRKKQGGKEKDG